MEITKQNLTPKLARHAPPNGFGADVQEFAAAVLELQAKRHSADYDPSIGVKSSDALLAVRTARNALNRFDKASAPAREAFLGLLLFSPR